MKDPTGRLARWAVKLGQHEYFVIHRPGEQMIAVDTLSRNFNMECFKSAVRADKMKLYFENTTRNLGDGDM